MSSDRIINSDCDIKLSIDDAKKNGELISLADCQIIRSVQKIKGIVFDYQKLESLQAKKRNLIKSNLTSENKDTFLKIIQEINNLLFVDDLVSVFIKDKRHYKKILDKFFINGKSYSRLLAGAGNIRRNCVLFCNDSIISELIDILDCGRDKDVPLVPNKYAVYFSLANSSTHRISMPKFCVIPDCEVERDVLVDWVHENENGEMVVTDKKKKIKFNLFDGEGLISPHQAEKWAKELEIDYLPATYIIRGAFTKGLLVNFDFHKLCEQKNIWKIKDIWEHDVDLHDIDVIFTASQVKLWMCYKSKKNFIDMCREYDFSFGINRISPKKDKDYVRSNYQFLQVLDLSDKQIESLCENTLDYFKDLSGLSREKMILYFTGAGELNDGDPLSSISDPMTQALVIDPKMRFDPCIRQHIITSLNKKIHESYIGSLFSQGNYSVMISDPYALTEHCLGLKPVGLLKDKEHYSNYWNKFNISQVAACRAPLTFISEINLLNFKDTKDTQEWYKYLYTGIVYNCKGIDVLLHADSDFDGDCVYTTNSQEIISGIQGGLPISYAKKISSKIIPDRQSLINSDVNGMHSKIGFITNCSSTAYVMINNLKKDTKEYAELFKRLKLFRFFQGENIDKAKTGYAKNMPSNWFKYSKIKVDDDEKIIQEKEFSNLLIIDKRPYFFRYIYPHYNNRYLKELKVYNDYCWTKFNNSFIALLNKNQESLSPNEKEIVAEYYKYSFFTFNDSVMNKICKYLERNIKEIKDTLRQDDFDWKILINDLNTNYVKVMFMIEIIEKYKLFKSKKRIKDDYRNFDALDIYIAYLRDLCFSLISADVQELASLGVYCTYKLKKGPKEFVWKLFPEGIIQNLKSNNDKNIYSFPVKSPNGDIKYLWKTYSLKNFSLS